LLPTTSPALLTKALLRSAEQLELLADLPSLLQLQPEEITQLQSGARFLDPQGPEWARALKVVSLFRILVSLLGTVQRARAWLGQVNETLGARPVELLRTPDDDRVYRYLNAVQKHELRLPLGFASAS